MKGISLQSRITKEEVTKCDQDLEMRLNTIEFATNTVGYLTLSTILQYGIYCHRHLEFEIFHTSS